MSDEFRTEFWDCPPKTATIHELDESMVQDSYIPYRWGLVYGDTTEDCGYVRVYKRKMQTLLGTAKAFISMWQCTGARLRFPEVTALEEAIAREEGACGQG